MEMGYMKLNYRAGNFLLCLSKYLNDARAVVIMIRLNFK